MVAAAAPRVDDAEALKAVVSAASPLAGSDKKLKEALDLAVEMLKAPLSGMPEVAEGLGAHIREAWALRYLDEIM